jgi:hypothetical protein
MNRTAGIAVVVVVALSVALSGRAGDHFDTGAASFAVSFHGETSAYRDVAVATLPKTAVTFEAVGGPPGDFSASAADGTLAVEQPRRWKWTAPDQSGTYRLTFTGPARGDVITVHAFVMVPAANIRDGSLNGYRIGAYPKPRGASSLYRPPAGFIEVTRANESTRVSPHFTLKQFVCKEDTTKQYPKYVVLHERLPLKLEAILERVNQLGVGASTLHLMSAYRTPYYNHSIGDTTYSMHQWGSAADVYVDPQNRDRMADLNGDGRVDVADAKKLYDEIETLLERPEYRKFQGGMGFYPATPAHPPFVHVDVRGTHARWQG